jgi:hypothetical protein
MGALSVTGVGASGPPATGAGTFQPTRQSAASTGAGEHAAHAQHVGAGAGASPALAADDIIATPTGPKSGSSSSSLTSRSTILPRMLLGRAHEALLVGRTMTERRPMLITPQPTWRPLIA